jgi:hypothetical protein
MHAHRQTHRLPGDFVPSAHPSIEQEIATVAAKLLSEDGTIDFAHAKRKAAKSLGLAEGKHLPSNELIMAELVEHQAIFYGAVEARNLLNLRKVAIKALKLFAEFRPFLVGRVLNGTAAPNSPVEIQVFAESAKAVEIFMLNQGIDSETGERNHRNPGRDAVVPVFSFMAEREVVAITVHEYDDLKSSPKSAYKQNGFSERATLAEVEALVQSSIAA